MKSSFTYKSMLKGRTLKRRRLKGLIFGKNYEPGTFLLKVSPRTLLLRAFPVTYDFENAQSTVGIGKLLPTLTHSIFLLEIVIWKLI
jgi:hypothetical protein